MFHFNFFVMKNMSFISLFILLVLCPIGVVKSATLKEQANAKIVELEALMATAELQSLDTERESAAVFFANEFIKYADWDEANKDKNEREFAKFGPYSADKVQMAEDLPDFERQQVIDMLDNAIAELTEVINGTIVRRPVPVVDWANISKGKDQFTSNGKPVFLYDYFSKSQGTETSNTTVYNDFFGSIDHPGSLNNHFIAEDMSLVQWRVNDVVNHPNTKIGFQMLHQF